MNWIFHPEYEPVIVNDQEYKKLLENGWFDSPAKFKNVPCETNTESLDLAEAQKEEVKNEITAEIKEEISGKKKSKGSV